MVANGVIGITAQIVASSDLPGGSNKPDDKSSMSIFQRMANGFKSAKQNFGKLVKNKGVGLMWMLLASSKVAQQFSLTVMSLLLVLVDLLLASLFPVINWLLNSLSTLITKVTFVIENLPIWFKEIFGGVWTWISDHAILLWGGILSLLGWDKQVDATTETEDFILEKIIGEVATQTQVEDWASDPEHGLIEGGPIDPSVWDASQTPSGTYMKEGEVDEMGSGNFDRSSAERVSWIYKGGPSTPPGGAITSELVGPLIGTDIILIDEELNKDDKQEFYDGFFTWLPKGDDEKFGWNDIMGWINQTAENYNFTKEDLGRYFFGTWEEGDQAGEKLMDGLLTKTIHGDPVTLDELQEYQTENIDVGGVHAPSAWLYVG